MDLTIAAQLAELEGPANDFAATDLIRTLLVYHISATSERRTHLYLSQQVILRCTQAFQVINQLMAESSQPLNWQIFDAFTEAIPVLESILLSYETADLYTQKRHLPDDDDVFGALRFIFFWDQERTQLVDALKGLASGELLDRWEGLQSEVEDNTKEFLQTTRSLLRSPPLLEIARDDLTMLTILWDFFGSLSSESLYEGVPKNTATNILDAMRREAFSSPHYLFAQIFLKSLILISIPFSLLSTRRRVHPKPLEDSTKEHLARGKIWNVMLRLTQTLSVALNDRSKWNDLNAIEAEYEHLQKLLLSGLPSSDPLVDETLRLLRLSAQISRPFQQRSVALIRLSYYPDWESSTAPSSARDEVRKVFQETIALLEATEETFRDRGLRASVTDKEYNERATAFESVFSKLRQCGKLLDPSNLWLAKEADFLAAVELDETHMKEQALLLG